MFDVNSFLATTYNDASSTESIPVPVGDHTGFVTKVTPKPVLVQGENRIVLDLSWEVADQSGAIKAVTGRDKNVVRQSIFLDTTPEGNLDMAKGMNVSLGKLRDALHQNDPGKAWSPNMILNVPARIGVEHRITDDGRTFGEVKRVSAL